MVATRQLGNALLYAVTESALEIAMIPPSQ